MANKKVYFNETPPYNTIEVEFKKTLSCGLLVSFTNIGQRVSVETLLTTEDAIELISELAFQFDLVNDDPEYPRPMWEGNPR